MRRLLLLAGTAALVPAQDTVVVGSKAFAESRILAEIMAQAIEARSDLLVERRLGLAGTRVCFAALRSGEIDFYPEYTGTGWSEVLAEEGRVVDQLQTYLLVRDRYEKRFGIRWLMPFGFDNTYALAMDAEKAKALGIERISDLVEHGSELRAAFSLEFLNRPDGYPGLREAYGLEFGSVRGIEHGISYPAILAGEVDVIDAYSTDGKLRKHAGELRVLVDDRAFFPPYNGAPNVRTATLQRHPELREVLESLAFTLPNERMQELNYLVEEEGLTAAEAAHRFLVEEGLVEGGPAEPADTTRRSERGFLAVMAARAGKTLELAWQHVQLTAIAVMLAALFAIPLGIAITRMPTLRKVSLSLAGVVQTIPSLALLAFMIPIPWLGLDVKAAIAALFLYAVLPILRNTCTGIEGIDDDLIDAARGMGLTDRQVLAQVELPLATRTIMAGVRTATVISIGVATLAAFIGAGGLGEPIVTGLQLNDTNLILSGAVPAALLALLADFLLGRVETALAPRMRS